MSPSLLGALGALEANCIRIITGTAWLEAGGWRLEPRADQGEAPRLTRQTSHYPSVPTGREAGRGHPVPKADRPPPLPSLPSGSVPPQRFWIYLRQPLPLPLPGPPSDRQERLLRPTPTQPCRSLPFFAYRPWGCMGGPKHPAPLRAAPSSRPVAFPSQSCLPHTVTCPGPGHGAPTSPAPHFACPVPPSELGLGKPPPEKLLCPSALLGGACPWIPRGSPLSPYFTPRGQGLGRDRSWCLVCTNALSSLQSE